MATQEKSLCIFFNSSQSGDVCNYNDIFEIYFDYESVTDCECWKSNELDLNPKNSSWTLLATDQHCLSVSCINCSWHINISYANPNDLTNIAYAQDFQSCNSRFIMTNCKNNVPIIDSSTAQINGMEYGYMNTFYIQETELCITWNTTGNEVACNYYPTNGNFCWFELELTYELDFEHSALTTELSINTEIPILVVPDELKCRGDAFSLTSNLDTLQLWLANNVPGNINTSETIYVFDSQHLSNLVETYDYRDHFVIQNSSTGSFSISQSSQWNYKLDWSQWFYYVFRIEDKQFSNCNNTNFVNYAFPFETTFVDNAAANTSGNCLTSILLPYANPLCEQILLPILYISSITYAGPSSVKVLSTIYNESYELFEFSEGSSTNWNNFVIYGNLISFIIPPNGALQVKYEALTSAANIMAYDFQDYTLGIIQSNNYPRNSSNQYTSTSIICTKGTAKITITLIYVEVPVGGYLQIIGQDQTKTYQNGIFENQTIIFNSYEIDVYYVVGSDGQTSTGLLLLYEGQYNSINGNKVILQKTWFIFIFALLYY